MTEVVRKYADSKIFLPLEWSFLASFKHSTYSYPGHLTAWVPYTHLILILELVRSLPYLTEADSDVEPIEDGKRH